MMGRPTAATVTPIGIGERPHGSLTGIGRFTWSLIRCLDTVCRPWSLRFCHGRNGVMLTDEAARATLVERVARFTWRETAREIFAVDQAPFWD